MGRLTLFGLAMLLVSGVLAVGRIGGEVVADIAIGVFILSAMLLGALLVSYWFARHAEPLD